MEVLRSSCHLHQVLHSLASSWPKPLRLSSIWHRGSGCSQGFEKQGSLGDSFELTALEGRRRTAVDEKKRLGFFCFLQAESNCGEISSCQVSKTFSNHPLPGHASWTRAGVRVHSRLAANLQSNLYRFRFRSGSNHVRLAAPKPGECARHRGR